MNKDNPFHLLAVHMLVEGIDEIDGHLRAIPPQMHLALAVSLLAKAILRLEPETPEQLLKLSHEKLDFCMAALTADQRKARKKP